MGKKKLECPVVSQICTLWTLRFHHFIFSLLQPVCPDIPSFAHFDDCCFTSNFFFLSLMQPIQMVTLKPPLVTHQLSITLQSPPLTRQPPSVTSQPPSVTRQPPPVTLHVFLTSKTKKNVH